MNNIVSDGLDTVVIRMSKHKTILGIINKLYIFVVLFRTYNYPQSRLTDHRMELTLYKLDSILSGDLDEVIDALITADRAEKLSWEKTYRQS